MGTYDLARKEYTAYVPEPYTQELYEEMTSPETEETYEYA